MLQPRKKAVDDGAFKIIHVGAWCCLAQDTKSAQDSLVLHTDLFQGFGMAVSAVDMTVGRVDMTIGSVGSIGMTISCVSLLFPDLSSVIGEHIERLHSKVNRLGHLLFSKLLDDVGGARALNDCESISRCL